jgi:DNA-binding HxlR family transcriptional regulator
VRREVLTGTIAGVRYSLTSRGIELARLLTELERWGESTLPPSPIAPPPITRLDAIEARYPAHARP